MAVAYESVSTTSWQTVTSGNNLTITKPTGLSVGDYLIGHLTAVRNGSPNADGWGTPSGWTQLISTSESDNLNSSVGMEVYYKLADSSDVAASNFSFVKSGNNSTRVIGTLFRISGGTTISASVGSDSTDSTPEFINTITPSANSLLLFLISVSEPSPVSGSVSGYAITTDNPTWTEVYDSVSVVADGGLHGGAYASRPEATATGDFTCTLVTTYQNSIGAIVAIAPSVSVTITPTVIDITSSVLPVSVSGGANVSTTVITATASVVAPTVSTPENLWINEDKNSSTWTNPDKS